MEQTKVCSSCGREKPLSEFNKCRCKKDGLQDRCRECFSTYNKERYSSAPERFKKAASEYREENIENVFATRMEMCRRNPSHKNAGMALSYALKLGYIEKPDHCLGCGRPDSESRVTAHHNDYSKPLEVVWVCSKCHRNLDANRREREGKSRYGKGRGVVLLLDGNDVCRFDTISDAAKAVGRKPNSISQCLSGKSSTCAGFGWRYEGD